MGGNAEIRLVIEQPIYDVCRFARGRNGCRVEWRMAGRDVGVEQRGWFAPVAVPGIVGAQSLAAPGGQERLAIGTGDIGEPEPRRERLALLGIDHHGQCLTIRVLAQVPACGPGEFPVAHD